MKTARYRSYWLAAVAAALGLSGAVALDASAQTAKIQAIHNSPYAEAALVDVYVNGIRVFDDFAFRSASGFVGEGLIPSGIPLTIDVTASDAADNSAPVFSKLITFSADPNILIAAGDPLNRAGQPPFDLYLFNPAKEAGTSAEAVSLLLFHGAPDAPAVDVPVRGTELKLADDLAFGSFTSAYADVPPASYALGISTADDADPTLVASFLADVSGLGGGASVALASGFLAPGAGDPGFEIIVVLTDGTVLSLPLIQRPEDARTAADTATDLVFEGTVTRAKGRAAVVQVGTSGIAVFQSSGTFRDAISAGDFAEGDEVVVVGNRSDFSGLQQIAPTNWLVLSRGNTLPDAQQVTLADIASNGEAYESALVRVVDLAVDAAGDTEFATAKTYGITDASDASGAVGLRAPSSSDTDIGGVAIPAAATFEGVLGQFTFSVPANDGYQLSMIKATDITAQTARAQIVHNSPDAAASVVDVYINDGLAIDDFSFRTATPFLDLPAGIRLDIAVAPGSSTSSAEAVATVPGVVLADGGSYIITASGLLSSTEAPFNLFVFDGGREAGVAPETVDALIFHGSPDAPAVDVIARLVGATLADDLAFGDYTPAYASIAPSTYFVDITTADNTAVAASFGLEANGAAGEAGVLMASGFLVPPGDEPGFALLLVLPDGSVTEMPNLASNVYAQVVHSSADPGVGSVDVYVDEERILDDFAYQQATSFLFLPSDMEIGITLAANEMLGETDPKFPVSLNAGSKYVVVASGLLAPEMPEDALTLLAFEVDDLQAKKADVDLLVVHTVTDAPAVDVSAGETTLVDALVYGAGEPLSVPPASYVLDVSLDEGGALVASFAVDLTGADGQLFTVLASGFVTPPMGSSGREFGLFTVDAEGNIGMPQVVTDTEDLAELPDEFVLGGNYPNPFNPTTKISFDLPEAAMVAVEVFDVLGRRVLSLQPQAVTPGSSRSLQVDASGLSSGLYIYRLTAELSGEVVVKSGQMTLLK